MPIYDYKCSKCKKPFEFFHAKTGEKAECSHCGSKRAKKQISKNTSHILKGKGWYKDGY
jgi:putative FmdB family regulatory protein